MVCAGSTGIRNCGAFCQTRRNLVNALYVHGERCCNPAKIAAIQGLRRFTRRHTVVRPSKCGTFGGRKATYMPPCFQVPLWHVCCILFDAYRICIQRTTRVLHVTKYTITMNVCSAPSDDDAKCNCVFTSFSRIWCTVSIFPRCISE